MRITAPQSLLILSRLSDLVLSNPIHSWSFLSRQAPSLDKTLDLPTGESVRTIALRRTPHDLQHSSRALRQRLAQFHPIDRTASQSNTLKAGTTLLRATGVSFLAPISFGSQPILSVIDTGSADTWVVQSGFICVDIITNQTIPAQRCFFGPQYTPDHEFVQIPDENFNITYGDGEYLSGIVGNVPVTIAGITVPKQQVSLPTLAAWQGDGITSGIIGLAYPALTANYPGTDPHQDRYCAPGVPQNECNQVRYSSLTNTMFFTEKISAPVFALALSRDESHSGNGGYLSIGGVPNLQMVGVTQNRFASTPIRILNGDDRLRYYTINVEGVAVLPAGMAIPNDSNAKWEGLWADNQGNFVEASSDEFDGRGMNGKIVTGAPRVAAAPPPVTSGSGALPGSVYQNYILDSGTTLSFLPSPIVSRFASMFQPPAQIDPSTGFYLVSCQAKIPHIGIKIGGSVFWHNQKDLVKAYDYTGQTCVLGIQDSLHLDGINILGDVFLDSVLAVFDLGAQQIRFAARREYQS